MTNRILGFLSVGLLALGLTFTTAQAQNDIAPTGGISVAELTDPIPLPQMSGALLYDNGPLANSAGTGIGGQDESVLQNISLDMNTLGFGHQTAFMNWIADDFVIPDPSWDINEIVTYAYQTNGGPGGSTMTAMFMCIYDALPPGGFIVWGDCTTDVMNATSFSNILRVTEESTGTTDGRSIYAQTSTAVVSLPTGTYWLVWQTDGSLASGPWAPPITITGDCVTGNGLQSTDDRVSFGFAEDSGTAACQQGLPFQIYGTVVPVELISFDAVVSGTDVSLNWATSSETNNAGFEVQSLQSGDWTALGFVEGHGTTTETQTYSYTAGGMAVGTHTFRLKQIDFDGAFEYSPEVEAVIEVAGTHQLSNAYPNPFNPTSQFTLDVATAQHVKAELFNTLGQRVAVLFDGRIEANQTQSVTIDGEGLASGMYVVRVDGERFSDNLSVTLLK